MILCFEYGRLGNQMLQYVGIKKCFPNHKIVLVGYDDLADVLDPVDAVIFKKRRMPIVLFFSVLRYLAQFLTLIRFVGVVEENANSSDFEMTVRNGIIPGVYLLRSSFFQHNQVVADIPTQVTLRPNLIDRAKVWATSQGVDLYSESLVFMHIRRGDYLAWPTKDFPAVLDFVWYQKVMELLNSKVQDPFYVVLSDDYYYTKDLFEKYSNVAISNNDLGVDLALMSFCRHGIMSASTFAWWGAWLSRQNKPCNDCNLYFAPKYWGGHRQKKWHPQKFKSDWITYVE